MLCKELKEESKMSLASLEEEGGEIRFKGSRKKHSPFVGGGRGFRYGRGDVNKSRKDQEHKGCLPCAYLGTEASSPSMINLYWPPGWSELSQARTDPLLISFSFPFGWEQFPDHQQSSCSIQMCS